ncbi:MAG: DUF58 domain-containing protein [Acidobacteriota bacterium]|nr:DUF58 domain-containing protein [Acidobacteriota bacterium]
MSRPRTYGSVGGSSVTRFLEPRTLARISNLDLAARTVVEGFISGLHKSPFFGRSLDFAEHRAYMPGDDIRLIDWRVFARSDRFYVKEFEADTNTNCTIFLDVSASMNFGSESAISGSTSISKLEYGKYLAACLAYFSHKQRDRVGLVTFDNSIVDFVPPSAKHLEEVLHTIDRIRPGGEGSLRSPLQQAGGFVKRRSIVVLISDFYEEPDEVLAAASLLRGRGNDVVAFHLLDPVELRFPYQEILDLEDLESSARISLHPEAIRAEYQRLIEGHVATLSEKLTEGGIDYHLYDTSVPLDFALYTYLSTRQRTSRLR